MKGMNYVHVSKYRCPWRTEECVRTLVTGFKEPLENEAEEGQKIQSGYWELNLDPLQQQYMLLAAGPPLWSLVELFLSSVFLLYGKVSCCLQCGTIHSK